MAWKKTSFGRLLTGEEVFIYILTNAGGMSASFSSLGGTWLKMEVPDRDGDFDDILLSYGSLVQCLKNPGHMGEIIGRCANRIGGASLEINGNTYPLAVNSGGKNNIHSGPDFYANRIWEARAGEGEEGPWAAFSLESPDGDQGYPGKAKITVAYTLKNDGGLRIDYRMTADQDTIANFTNHAYFNLAGHKSGSVLSHKVWIDADFFTETDDVSIPTGKLIPVAGTPMDFTSLKEIGRDIDADYEQLRLAKGFDHNWVLNHKKGEFSLCAKLVEETRGRAMEVYTDLPGLQFYTANYLNAEGCKEGAHYKPRGGCCFETQYFPDAVHMPQFDSPILKAGEEYHTVTEYRFLPAT